MACGTCNGQSSVVEHRANGTVIDRTNPCEAVTIDTLRIYQWAVQCLRQNQRYETANVTPLEAQNADEVLGLWIADKEIDYKSCTYQDYLPLMQDLVKRIITSGICR